MWTYIVFRDTAAGRTAFVEGTGLAVWEIMMIARCYGGDTARTAQHLEIPEALVRAAINDRDAFPS
ncbi:MAG: hypothetical protein JOZ41_10940 [Chloroflexi bacterium]|nr:hypothetical protein [Chloroflexota bacterium]